MTKEKLQEIASNILNLIDCYCNLDGIQWTPTKNQIADELSRSFNCGVEFTEEETQMEY